MKLYFYIILFLMCSMLIQSGQKNVPGNKGYLLECHAHAEHETHGGFTQLKRRYPRHYNAPTIEGDDFGFAAPYSKRKKSCKA